MSPHDAIDLGRTAILLTLLISSPILVAGMIVGLVMGLLQAVTQVQEQTIAFVPKLVAMLLTLALCLPWLLTQMTQYFEEVFTNIPQSF